MTEGEVMVLKGKFTIDTLCAHILDGWHNRTRAHKDLRAYHGRLLALMCQELGVEWHDDPKAMKRAWLGISEVLPDAKNVHQLRPPTAQPKAKTDLPPMPHVLATICESYSNLETPLASFLEYGASRQEQAILDAHIGGINHVGGINHATEDLRRKWRAWLRDMLLMRWPGAAGRRTNWTRFSETGLGDPPDVADYF